MTQLDDLIAQLPHTTGVARVDLLNDIALAIYGQSPEQMRRYCHEALTLAQQLGYTRGVAVSYKNIGVSFWAQAEYAQAEEWLNTAVAHYEQIGDAAGLARCYNNLGIVNETRARYITALEYLIKAAEASERTAETTLLSTIYLNMADIYSLQENHPKALALTQRALEVFTGAEDELHHAGIYGKLGEVYAALGQYETAQAYMSQAMALAHTFGSQYHVGRYSTYLSQLYNRLGRPAEGLETAEQAIAAGQALTNKRITGQGYVHLGEALHLLGRLAEARQALGQGLALAEEAAVRETEAEAHQRLAEVCEAEGDFAAALHHYRQHITLKEALVAEKHSILVTEMQTRYEVERQQRQAEVYRLRTEEMAAVVADRTADLASANARLQQELEEHHRTALELVAARDQAEEASRAKSAFLTNVSHELRTPLNAIIGYGELLLEEATEQGQTNYVADMNKLLWSARHLLGIINDILDLAKIEAGNMEVRREPFGVWPLVKLVSTAARPLMERQNNQFHIECPPHLPLLVSDEQKVRQILLNLLSNAAKFTHKGQITLTIARQATAEGRHELVCTVADTGIGMSEADQQRLFQPFTQLDTSPSRLYEGTGLGLTITHHFCHLLGGRMMLESELGRGSTFTIYLPWVEEDREER